MDLQAIEARLEAATPGPWDFDTIPETGESRVVVRSNAGDPMLEVSVATHGVSAEDAEFLAHAPEDIQTLIAEVLELEAWKREALTVMDGLQELGKALGLPIGEQVTGPEALAKVKELKESRDGWVSYMMEMVVTKQELEAVKHIHRKMPIYDTTIDDCSEHDEHNREPIEIDGEWYCDQHVAFYACAECRDSDGEYVDYPCSTARALGVTE